MRLRSGLVAGVLAAMAAGGLAVVLAPERSAVLGMPAAAARLERAAASEGAFEAQARSLADAASAYMSTYVPQVIRSVTTNPSAARSVATTTNGDPDEPGLTVGTAAA